MTTLAQEHDIATILRDFRGNPQEASALAEFLGFEPLPNPQDQLAGPLSGGCGNSSVRGTTGLAFTSCSAWDARGRNRRTSDSSLGFCPIGGPVPQTAIGPVAA